MRSLPPSVQSDLASLLDSPVRRELTEIPDMFGDFGFIGPTLSFLDETGTGIVSGTTTVPFAGGLRGTKIAEYNSAVPTDRVFATYHYFHNTGPETVSIDNMQGTIGTARRDQSIHRWLVGMEKTFFDGWMSVELRLPFYQLDGLTAPFVPLTPAGLFDVNSPDVGNLSVILKHMVDLHDHGACSWGLGIETPTASDTTVVTGSTRFEFENNVVRLAPFLAVTEQLSPRWFAHGFTQLEIPLGGYDVAFDDRFDPAFDGAGSEFDDPVSMMFDVGAGYWILPPSRTSNSTLAVLTEFHYTVALTDTDRIPYARTNSGGFPVSALLSAQRPNYLNFTVGVQWATRSGWEVRGGSAFPITRNDRLFDVEPMLQIARVF